jgi:hypothetical protein
MAKEEQEAAYQAVLEYWPAGASAENERHAWLAKRGLAAWYLKAERLDDARGLYEELAGLPPADEPVLRLTGIAGMAVVYDRMGSKLRDQTPLLVCLATLQTASDEDLSRIGSTLLGPVRQLLEEHQGSE